MKGKVTGGDSPAWDPETGLNLLRVSVYFLFPIVKGVCFGGMGTPIKVIRDPGYF